MRLGEILQVVILLFTLLRTYNMIDEKVQNKKTCSETSFHKEIYAESKRRVLKQESLTNGLCLKNCSLNKKCSKSLSDLWRQVNNEVSCVRRNDACVMFNKDNHKIYFQRQSLLTTTDENNNNNNNKTARRRILNLLMLNAWRRQKLDCKLAQEKIENLNYKLEGFEMQVYVLRQLLNTEKKRVETANDIIQDLLQKGEDINEDKAWLLKENEELKSNYSKLILYCTQIENALKNQENDIITSRLEAENWEKQLEKEREKLKKMESEEIFLKEKIRLNEKVIMLKTQQVDQLTQANIELQQKLDVQVPLWDETMAQVDLANAKLEESEIIKNELQKALEEKDKTIKELKSTIATLERKLREEDEKNGLLGKSITEKTNELTLVQTKILELSKNHYPWSGGIIRMASLCAKIPVACICTVGSLLLPFPSYRF